MKENVPVERREVPEAVRDEVARLNAELGERGRVLVRPSGTEPLIQRAGRGGDGSEAETLCASIASLVRQELG